MRYEDPNVPMSVLIGIVGAVLLFVIIVVLQVVFYRMEATELETKVYSQPSEARAKLDAEQLEQLNSYGWVNQAESTTHIPIDRAMELVVAESR